MKIQRADKGEIFSSICTDIIARSFNPRVADTWSPLTQNLTRKKDPDATYA